MWHVRNSGVHYIVNQGLVHMDIATRNLPVMVPFVPLSDEEGQAIRDHNWQYIEENRNVTHSGGNLTHLLR